MSKKLDTQIVPFSKIIADKEQPRRNFDASRMNNLIESIKRHGIMQPLVVEESGKFLLLVDGERRFRAAKELGMKEVPVRIIESQSPIDRLIMQFHVQAQHEDWSATEKAKATGKLAKELKLSIKDACALLALPDRTIGTYLAFNSLIEQEGFEKSEMPLRFATTIVSLRNFAERTMEKLEKPFNQAEMAKFENGIFRRFKNGEIKKTADILKLRDSIRMKPDVIKMISDTKETVKEIFSSSRARVAMYHRNITMNGRYLLTSINRGLELGASKLLTDREKTDLKRVAKAIESLL